MQVVGREAEIGVLEAALASAGEHLAGRLLGGSDRDAGTGHLTEALRIAEQCGARRTADEATRELRRLGRRVGRGGTRGIPGGGVASLSQRERDIGALVTQGLTNKQIAARLFLSEKTVESHLSRAFAKLDVRSRAALAARVAEGD